MRPRKVGCCQSSLSKEIRVQIAAFCIILFAKGHFSKGENYFSTLHSSAILSPKERCKQDFQRNSRSSGGAFESKN